MNEHHSQMGNLDDRGILPVLQSAWWKGWSGVFRIRHERQIAAIWLTAGHVVHVMHMEGKTQTEGLVALQNIARWREGTFLVESGALPPARTIRLPMNEVLTLVKDARQRAPIPSASGTAQEESGARLAEVLGELRTRVPGLESLSLTRGVELRATTLRDDTERSRLHRWLQTYLGEEVALPERLFVQHGDQTLLVVKNGDRATVLAARGETAPEALFWAGEEVRKRVLSSEETAQGM